MSERVHACLKEACSARAREVCRARGENAHRDSPIRFAARSFAVLFLAAALTLSGCAAGLGPAPASAGGDDSALAGALKGIGGAPAVLAVSEAMRPFFAAGLGFVVLGGIAVSLGGRGAGFLLLLLGAATTAAGVLFVQYPWTVLVLALGAGLVAALAVYDRRKARLDLAAASRELDLNRETLEATTAVIQNIPEGKAIKAGLAGLGRETEEKIRSVIGPIKDKLRREGKLASLRTS